MPLEPGPQGSSAWVRADPVRQDVGGCEGDGRLLGGCVGEVGPLPELLNGDRQSGEPARVVRVGPARSIAARVSRIEAAPVYRGSREEPTDVTPQCDWGPVEMRAAQEADGPGAVLSPSR